MLQITPTPQPQHLSTGRRAAIWLAVLVVLLTHGAGPAWAGAMTRNAAYLQGVKIASSLTTTDGFVLTYVGANSDLELKAAAAGGSGAVTLISTQTAATSASLSWTGLTGTNYRLDCSSLIPVTDGVGMLLQFGESTGPTWKTTSYLSAGFGGSSGGSTTGPNFDTSGIDLHVSSVGTGGGGISLTANLYNLSGAVNHHITWSSFNFTGGGSNFAGAGGGRYTGDTAAITAVRVIPTTGNITSGSCSLYSLGT